VPTVAISPTSTCRSTTIPLYGARHPGLRGLQVRGAAVHVGLGNAGLAVKLLNAAVVGAGFPAPGLGFLRGGLGLLQIRHGGQVPEANDDVAALDVIVHVERHLLDTGGHLRRDGGPAFGLDDAIVTAFMNDRGALGDHGR
jgi:hypothetical protein